MNYWDKHKSDDILNFQITLKYFNVFSILEIYCFIKVYTFLYLQCKIRHVVTNSCFICHCKHKNVKKVGKQQILRMKKQQHWDTSMLFGNKKYKSYNILDISKTSM